MKNNVLKLLGMLSKYAMIGLLAQCMAYSILLASEGKAQKARSVYDVEIQLDRSTAKTEDLLSVIEAKTEYVFAYDKRDINLTQTIQVEKPVQKIADLLIAISRKEGVGFKQINNNIFIKKIKKKEAVEEKIEVVTQAISVSGKVTSQEDGEGIPGVNIVIKNTTQGTVTDVDGNYRIDVPSAETILVFSSVGFLSEEITVGNQTEINVAMNPDVKSLEEIVVIGYGTVKKSDLTGSVSSVTSEDFTEGVNNNALQLLNGKAAGVNISQSSSEPGGALTIRVRGAGSINSSNNVLVVIDGLPGADPSSLNPADVESIEILKDASAAAIYGTRAANGVVLITTKKGSIGKPQVSYDGYWAFQTPASKLDVLNATQYMQMINDINVDGGNAAPFTQEQIAAAGVGTDWQEELFRNAMASNHQLSVNGGTENTKYYVSLGYLDQDGIMVSSGLKKYNTLINLEATPSDKFKFGLSLNGVASFKDLIANSSDAANENADPLNAAIQFDPRLTAEKDENGLYQTNPSIALDNPIAMAYGYDDKDQSTRLYGNTYGEYQIIDGLKASLRLGTDLNNRRFDSYKDRTTQKGRSSNGIGSIQSWVEKYWMVEGLLRYDKEFGSNHRLSLLGGATWERFMNEFQVSSATGFLSDVTGTNLLSSGNRETFNVNSSKINRQLQSFIARVNYTFRDKYLFTATVRRDGSSRFSENHKYATFPSVAVGWRIAEEGFMSNVNVLSDLKLRIGYGQMGNEGINNFETIQTFVSGGNTVLGGAIQNGAQPARIPNPDLKWETTEEYNFGIDFGLLEDRIYGAVDYYIKNTKDQLFNQPVPMSTGFANVRTNFGEVRNSGVEVSVNSTNLTGKFQWNTQLTFASLKNEVIELPPFVGDIITTGSIGTFTTDYALVQEGYPMQAYYGYKVLGIFQNEGEVANSAQPNASPGEPIYQDTDNNGKIDAYDRVVLGDPFPDITYSLNNTFSYKNFNLEIFLLGVEGISTMNSNIVESLKPVNFDRNILTEHYLDRWTENNPDAEFPSGVNSSTYFNGGKVVNSYTIQDASFFRLKNVTLSYRVPVESINLFKAATVYVSGDNLFTITKFDGYDPDANQSGTNVGKTSYNNYPLARVFRAGVHITF